MAARPATGLQQVVTGLGVDLVLDDNGCHVSCPGGDSDEGQQSLFSWTAHPNPGKAASVSHDGLPAALERTSS